jgi:cytochrome b6-f complex iron-sulfur subunit
MNKLKQITRRNFFSRFFYSLLTLQIGYLFFRVLKPDKSTVNQKSLYEAGQLSFFEKGRLYPFSSENFFLYCLDDGGFLALSSKCTHLGCAIQYQPGNQRFECPCHASAFNKTGEVLSPPATRTLDCFRVKIEDKKVWVDTNTPVRRDHFDPSQIIYA